MSVSFALAPPVQETSVVQEAGGGPSSPVPLLATVPSPTGSTRLHFTWGLGNRISLCPLANDSTSTFDDVDGDVTNQQQLPGASSPSSSEPPAASVVQWGSFSSSERVLAFNSLPLFEALQSELLRSGTRSPTWLRAVRSYANDISALMAMGRGGAGGGKDNEGDDTANASLAVERCAWDWTALLFLSPGREDGSLGPSLRRWACQHASALLPCSSTTDQRQPETLRAAVSRLLASPAPERELGYWATAARAAALGSYGAAVSLLGAHSAWNDALASAAAAAAAADEVMVSSGFRGGQEQQNDDDEDGRRAAACLAALEPVGLLLRRAPRLALGTGEGGARVDDDDDDFGFGFEGEEEQGAKQATAYSSLPAFLEARKTWLAAVRSVARDDGLWARAAGGGDEAATTAAATAAGARKILAVVSGDRTALDEAVAVGDPCLVSWAELLVARALHAGGGAGPRGAAELAHAARRAFDDAQKISSAGNEETASRDALLLSLADAAGRGEPHSAAAALSASCGSWLMAHVAPLLASSFVSLSSSAMSNDNDDDDVSSSSPSSTRGIYLPHAGLGSVEWAASDYAAALAGGGGGATAEASAATRAAAARVLSLCPATGKNACAALFHHVACGVVSSSVSSGDDSAAERVIAEAERLGATAAAGGVARVAGAAAAGSGRVGAALSWLSRGGGSGAAERTRAVAGPLAVACADALLMQPLMMKVDDKAQSLYAFSSRADAAAALEDLSAPLSEALGIASAAAPSSSRRGGLVTLKSLLDLERAEAFFGAATTTTSAANAKTAVVAAAAAAARAAPNASYASAALLRAVPALESSSSKGSEAAAAPAAHVVDDAIRALAEAEAEMRREQRVSLKKSSSSEVSALATDAVRLALARALARAYLSKDNSASVGAVAV